MPRFKIRPVDQTHPSTEVIASDGSAILNTLCRLNCGEADVLIDDQYMQSVRLDGNGVWHIFQRAEPEAGEACRA
jgi:hypothetical protein